MAIDTMGWVLVYTDNVAEMRRFYEDVVGLPLQKASEKIVAFKAGGCILELMGRMENGPDKMDDSRGWDRNKVLMSFHAADLEAEVAALESRGAKCLKGIHPTVSPPGVPPRGRVAQFMDPDGNIFELCDVPLG